MGKVWLTLLFIFFASGLRAQQVQWYAEAPDEVFANGQFEISFVLTNARGNKLKFPDFNGLEVLAGPNTANSVSIINGSRSSSISYTLVLRAGNQGPISIGPASIEVDGRIYKTKALTIKVKKGDLGPNTQNGIRAIAKMELSGKKVYVGQQVTARYKLYYNENLAFSDELKHPDFTGFYHKQLGAVNQPVPGMRLGNREYTGMLVDAIALFPQKPGRYAIKPSLFPLRKRSAGDDPFFNPFGNYEDFPIQSNGDELQVIPLPDNKDEDYIGALGQYSAEVEVKNSRISTDEAVTLYITVTGNGNSQQVEAPRLPLAEGLEIYPAKLVEEDEFVENQQLWHKKTFEYLISASKPGPYTIRPKASFFNPESGKFEPFPFEEIEITVSQGKVREEKGYLSSTPVKEPSNFFLMAVAGSAGIMLLLFGGFLYMRQKKLNAEPLSETGQDKELRRNNAARLALSKMEKARGFMELGQQENFYIETAFAIHGYLQEKYDIATEDLRKDYIAAFLRKLTTQTDYATMYLEIMNKTDLALYGASRPADISATYQKSINFISELELLSAEK